MLGHVTLGEQGEELARCHEAERQEELVPRLVAADPGSLGARDAGAEADTDRPLSER